MLISEMTKPKLNLLHITPYLPMEKAENQEIGLNELIPLCVVVTFLLALSEHLFLGRMGQIYLVESKDVRGLKHIRISGNLQTFGFKMFFSSPYQTML